RHKSVPLLTPATARFRPRRPAAWGADGRGGVGGGLRRSGALHPPVRIDVRHAARAVRAVARGLMLVGVSNNPEPPPSHAWHQVGVQGGARGTLAIGDAGGCASRGPSGARARAGPRW